MGKEEEEQADEQKSTQVLPLAQIANNAVLAINRHS